MAERDELVVRSEVTEVGVVVSLTAGEDVVLRGGGGGGGDTAAAVILLLA